MAWGSQRLIFGLSQCCDVSHTSAWWDIICHLPHLPVLRAIYNNNRSSWYLLIRRNKMSFEILYFHSASSFILCHSAAASVSFSFSLKRTWPLTPSAVADWALWDANWPCKNIWNYDILPCRMWKTHCRLISFTNSCSGDHNLCLAGRFFKASTPSKIP